MPRKNNTRRRNTRLRNTRRRNTRRKNTRRKNNTRRQNTRKRNTRRQNTRRKNYSGIKNKYTGGGSGNRVYPASAAEIAAARRGSRGAKLEGLARKAAFAEPAKLEAARKAAFAEPAAPPKSKNEGFLSCVKCGKKKDLISPRHSTRMDYGSKRIIELEPHLEALVQGTYDQIVGTLYFWKGDYMVAVERLIKEGVEGINYYTMASKFPPILLARADGNIELETPITAAHSMNDLQIDPHYYKDMIGRIDWLVNKIIHKGLDSTIRGSGDDLNMCNAWLVNTDRERAPVRAPVPAGLQRLTMSQVEYVNELLDRADRVKSSLEKKEVHAAQYLQAWTLASTPQRQIQAYINNRIFSLTRGKGLDIMQKLDEIINIQGESFPETRILPLASY